MFFIGENNSINISKGDSALLSLDLTKGDNPYTMQTGDKLIFAVKARDDFNNTIINKVATDPEIAFYTEDTAVLSAINAVYSITMQYGNGNIDTFLNGDFNILGVCYENE